MRNNRPRLLFTLLAALLATGSAWAFAYILNNNTGLPIKWPTTVFPVRIMLGTSPGGVDYNAAADAAAQTWNAILGNTRFSTTIASGSAGDRNRVNELAFGANAFGQAFDTNVVAITTTWLRGNERTEADIIFNSNRTWGVYNGPTQSGLLDLRRVALHELGHALGLDHPDEAGQNFSPPVPIMNSRITGNDTLTSDDIIGAQNLYGPPGTPANDNFANALTITLASGSISVNGHNTNATKQAGEPNHAGNSGGHSVWWRWSAPSAGPVALDTRGSYFDTTLGVYTGAAVGSLSTIASNDDINPGIVQASSLTFNATAGTTYYFGVDGFDADSAGITLNLSFTGTGPSVPVITTQPVSTSVSAGGNASFTVTATNATTYQWFFNGASITGATSPAVTIPNAQAANAGSYFVTATNAAGSVTSDTATLTVNTPAPQPTPPPSSGGGGGGGGAPSLWFYGVLVVLALVRFRRGQ